MSVDPRAAHAIDARILMSLLPGVATVDLPEIRRQFAQWLARPGRSVEYDSWAEAWNLWTGAALNRPGSVTYTSARCRACGGRGWSVTAVSRNLSRTGNALVCHECRGSRRGKPTTLAARYATPSAPDGD
ncbi:hypothetical protein [Nocardioides pakistanensis]